MGVKGILSPQQAMQELREKECNEKILAVLETYGCVILPQILLTGYGIASSGWTVVSIPPRTGGN